MKIKKIVAAMLAAALAFVSVAVPDVSAATYDLNNVDWGYIYAESQCGVDYTQIQPTDYGSSLADIITKYGTTTFDNNLAFIQNSLETKGYPPDYVNNLMQYYKNYLHNTKVTGENLGHYATQKAERFVDNALDVSGNNFWNSVYNKLFNNQGYNEQTETTGATTYTYTYDNVSCSVFLSHWAYPQAPPMIPVQPNLQTYMSNIAVNDGSYGYGYYYGVDVGVGGGSYGKSYCIIGYTINGQTGYVSVYKNPYTGWDGTFQVRFEPNGQNTNVVVDIGFTTVVTTLYLPPTGIVTDDETTTILPEQVGFYIDPTTGQKVPIYTDPSRNNFAINPDGTITLPDGTIVPIKIDPDELSPDGWAQIFDYDVKNPQPFNPQGIPWQDVKIIPDGSGGSTISGLGEALEGLFKGLGEGIAAAVTGVADAVADTMGGLGELVDDLTSLDWLGDIGEIDFNVFNFTTPLNDIVDIVLQLLGLGAA